MKTPFKLSIITIALALLMPISSYSQSSDNDKSGLVGTAWNMVQNVNDNAHSHRTMYFKKDFTFESRNTDGSIFNGGKYSLINDNTFVTIHYGAQTANLFTYTIKNDTLHFKGNFIFFEESEHRIGYIPIEEIFVKLKD